MVRQFHRLGSPTFFIHKAKKLDLSDEQVDKLKALKRDQQKSVIEKKAQIQIAHVELEELLDQEPVKFDKLEAKIAEIGDLDKGIRLDHLDTIQKARKVLTADQLEKAKALRKPLVKEKKGSQKRFMLKKLKKETKK